MQVPHELLSDSLILTYGLFYEKRKTMSLTRILRVNVSVESNRKFLTYYVLCHCHNVSVVGVAMNGPAVYLLSHGVELVAWFL